MPGLRRSLRLPMMRRRSAREQAIETLRSGLREGLRSATVTLREAREAVADARLPEAVGTSLGGLVSDAQKLSAVSLRAADLHPPELHLPDVTRTLRVDGLHAPDVGLPDIRLDAGGLRAIGRRAGSARDFVGSLPEYRVRRQARSASTGAILGAVLVGMIGGLWLATWPVTAPRVRAFFEALRSRLGLNGGWSADAASVALHRIDGRPGTWREGPLSRRRRRNAVPTGEPDGRGGIAGVAVGPGHPDEADLGAPLLGSQDADTGSSVTAPARNPDVPRADEDGSEQSVHPDAGHPGMPGHRVEPG